MSVVCSAFLCLSVRLIAATPPFPCLPCSCCLPVFGSVAGLPSVHCWHKSHGHGPAVATGGAQEVVLLVHFIWQVGQCKRCHKTCQGSCSHEELLGIGPRVWAYIVQASMQYATGALTVPNSLRHHTQPGAVCAAGAPPLPCHASQQPSGRSLVPHSPWTPTRSSSWQRRSGWPALPGGCPTAPRPCTM